MTNVATVIVNHPDLVKNIDRIMMVAGKRPGDLFHPGQQWWFHFRDFNIRYDNQLLDLNLLLTFSEFSAKL